MRLSSLFRTAAASAMFLAGITASAATADIPGATIAPSPNIGPTPFKLTVGSYSVAGGGLPAGPGLDVNLRYSYDSGHVWLGWFRSPALGFSQLRAGWDGTYTVGVVRLLPSLQLASGGFVGGSLAAETGTTWFAGAGLGRTNLRNYANLNFDPNDSVTLYGGYRWDDADSVAVQVVRDNRLNPDQQNAHLIWRNELDNGGRITLDLLAKQGTVDGQFIRRYGLSATYDWPHWFVRAAWDPKVNFTAQDMLRVSAGTRF
jgi:hypothetical protein